MPATHSLSDQFAQLRQQRGVMVGLLLLLVIVVFWVALGLFSSQQRFAVPKAMRDLARPLSPVVDENTLARLESKRAFSQAELTDFTIYKVIVSEVTKQLRLVDISYNEEEPVAGITPPAQVSPTVTSSGSANLTPTTAPTSAGVNSATPSATPAPTLSVTP